MITLMLHSECIKQPALLTFTLLYWDIDDNCNGEYLEVNSVKLCGDDAKTGEMHVVPRPEVSNNRPLRLQLTLKTIKEKRGFLIRYQGKTMISRDGFSLDNKQQTKIIDQNSAPLRHS